MKIKTLMYLDKFLEAPELIAVFKAEKKVTLKDIKSLKIKNVIGDIKENYNEEAYMNAQDAIDDLISGGDVSLDNDNAFYMWFESDLID